VSRLAGVVLRIFVRVIRFEHRRRSPGALAGARIAAVSFPQRFGSSLNAHFHYHVLATDGVFSEDAAGDVRFHEATGLSPAPPASPGPCSSPASTTCYRCFAPPAAAR
jgi:hypothetical protein